MNTSNFSISLLKTIMVLIIFSSVNLGCNNNDEIFQKKISNQDIIKNKSTLKNRTISSDIKVMTYNTHLFLITKYEDDIRQTEVIKFLKQHSSTDIFVLTEVWTDASKRAIVQALNDTHPYFTHTENNGIVGDGLLIISKLPIHKQSFEKFKNSSGADALSQKGFWELEMATKEGAGFYLYTTHLQADNDNFDIRSKQIDQMLIKMNTKKDYPIILAGDLNIPTTGTEYTNNISSKLSFLKDPISQASKLFNTYDEVNNKLAQHFDTDKNVVEQSRLDYILVSNTGNIEVFDNENKVFAPKYNSPRGGNNFDVSDHNPFQTKLKITTSKTSIPVNIYNSLDEAKTAVNKMKSNYGNGVSGLTIISNQTTKILHLKKKTILEGGEFFTLPPSYIPSGKYGAYLVVHPQSEALGVDSSIEYYIGSSQDFFSTKTIIPWGVASNKINGVINSVASIKDNKTFSNQTNGYILEGNVSGGTSPNVNFIIKN
ncbi:endonuclease/exonuclease/phosphatase family protein [Tenacibaculum sp. 190524A02b]|uniref:endonuclease/exonuclease/phosphatase family protein n=1 Tax=Tenacibaculum vairaonense TaxID=3137860 RepID=UPI0031FB0AD7